MSACTEAAERDCSALRGGTAANQGFVAPTRLQ
jgi:hypothetical protein